MALGKHRSVGEFLPIIKYDARIGYFLLCDRVRDTDDVWRTEQTNIENEDFRAVFDLKNMQVGWIDFPSGSAPDTKLVGVGENWGDPPSKKHKLGARVLVKMDDTIDGSVRELMSTSVGLWAGLDKLHDAYVDGSKDHPGEVPVVVITNCIKTETSQKTSFEPVFAIEEWIARPGDLPLSGIAPAGADKKKPSKSEPGMDDQIPF